MINAQLMRMRVIVVIMSVCVCVCLRSVLSTTITYEQLQGEWLSWRTRGSRIIANSALSVLHFSAFILYCVCESSGFSFEVNFYQH